MFSITQIFQKLSSQNGYPFEINFIDGLQVWYDVTDNSTITVSASILTQLRDKSGNGNHSNPTGTQRPTIGVNTLTGKQILNMGLVAATGLPLTTELSNATYTLFLVISCPNPTAFTQVFIGGSSQNDYIQPSGNRGDGDSIISAGGGSSQTYQDDFTYKEICVICIRQLSGVTQIWECNGRGRLRTTGTVPSVAHKIGVLCNLNNSFPMGGAFAGFAYYNSFLSSNDAFRVTRKLIQTHNINPSIPSYKIIGFGDSYTVGQGASDVAHSWLSRVSATSSKAYANEGISGTRFQDLGSSIDGINRYTINLLEYPYHDSLYILYGFNDIINIAASASAYQDQLGRMVSDLLTKGYIANQIYLGTVPRRYGDSSSLTTQQYGAAVRTIASTYGTHLAEIYNAQVSGGGDTLYAADLLHPNDAGHKLIADTFLAS